MAGMGNTGNRARNPGNRLQQEQEEGDNPQEENRPPPQAGGRSNIVYHVMINRGNTNTSEIHREEIHNSEELLVQDTQSCSEEETSSSEDVGYADDENEQLVTLQILSRLLGMGSNLRQRFRPPAPPSPDPLERPQPTPMDPSCDLYKELKCSSVKTMNIVERTRALHYSRDMIPQSEQITTTSQFLPKHCCIADVFETRVFCGTHSDDGNKFICAPQDGNIFLYNCEGSQFSCYKAVEARDVGWSVLSTSFSPDQNWFSYTTWSPCVQICNVHGDDEHHYSLDLHPEEDRHFCAFNAIFSPDNKELLAATSDGKLYIYNRERNQRTLAVNTHQDDANGLAFSDSSGQILYTTGDDGLCKVWDRRAFITESPCPVGIFAGHKDGITHVDSRNDGRYLITNSKDQSIKLWDIRKFSSREGIEATLSKVSRQAWDYRWEDPPRRAHHECQRRLSGDSSVMTYTGHRIKNTLIRCKFSPPFTTGQRYIYTGCANGRVIIYDVLTGEIISKLHSDQSHLCVRDVSWNPYQVGVLVATAWDGTLQLWSPEKRDNYANIDREGQQHPQFQFW